jgi:hypothetical protein
MMKDHVHYTFFGNTFAAFPFFSVINFNLPIVSTMVFQKKKN